MLLKLGTGNGERGTGNGQRGTGNREQESGNESRVYSGNPPENSKAKTDTTLDDFLKVYYISTGQN